MPYDKDLQKIYYDANPEAYLKRYRAYYRKNREKILAKKAEQYRAKRASQPTMETSNGNQRNQV